jgi:hypothetical protein
MDVFQAVTVSHPSRKGRVLDGAQSIVGESVVKYMTGPPACNPVVKKRAAAANSLCAIPPPLGGRFSPTIHLQVVVFAPTEAQTN